MKINNITHRVFVVGCPRSGTTLLQSAIMAGKETFSMPETWFFVHMERKRIFKDTALGKLVFYSWQCFKWRKKNKLPMKNIICKNQYDCACKYVADMDNLALASGKSGWLEKTPNHLWHIDAIENLVPAPKFIHILRRARPNIGSLLEWSSILNKSMSPTEAFELWLNNWKQSVRYLGHPSHLHIEYESLISNFDHEMSRVKGFLNISIPDLETLDLRPFSQLIVDDYEIWKKKNLSEGKLTNSGLTKYDKWVTGAELEKLEFAIKSLESLLLKCD